MNEYSTTIFQTYFPESQNLKEDFIMHSFIDAQRCPICGHDAKVTQIPPSLDGLNIECKICGKYEISGTAVAGIPHVLQHDGQDKSRLVSSYLRNMSDNGTSATLCSTDIKNIISSK
jgi:hypothetical protein